MKKITKKLNAVKQRAAKKVAKKQMRAANSARNTALAKSAEKKSYSA